MKKKFITSGPVEPDHRLRVARTAAGRNNYGRAENLELSWGKLAKVLIAAPKRRPETMAEYHGLPKSAPKNRPTARCQAFIKDARGLCCGHAELPASKPCGKYDRARTSSSFLTRSMWALDIDGATPEFILDLDVGTGALANIEYVWHTTISSTPDKPRVRVFGPLENELCARAESTAAREHPPFTVFMQALVALVRKDHPGIEIDEAASCDSARLYYRPTLLADAPHAADWNRGGFLPAERMIKEQLEIAAKPYTDARADVPRSTARQPANGYRDNAPEIARRWREIFNALDVAYAPSSREKKQPTSEARCPQCGDEDASVDIVDATGQMICRYCPVDTRRIKSVISYVAEFKSYTTAEAIADCREILGLPPQGPPPPMSTEERLASLTDEEQNEDILALAARAKTDEAAWAALVVRCSALPSIAYERQRRSLAKAAKTRVGALDAEVYPAVGASGNTENEAQADTLVRYGEGLHLFLGDAGNAYADIVEGEVRETHRLNTTPFRDWLRSKFFRQHGKAARGEAVKQAVETLSAMAKHGPDPKTHPVFLRSTMTDGRIYLDLCDEDWQAVEVSDQGWHTVASPPVRFRRGPDSSGLPVPGSGAIDELRSFVNVASDDDFVLLVSWMLYALRGLKPFPVLVLVGEQGTGKSTLCRILKLLIDPNSSPLRSMPTKHQDLMVSALWQHVLCFDNISNVRPGLSDSLCRLADGTGSGQRQLYSDDEEFTLSAARPMILNGITEFVSRADLADRAVFVTLKVIPDEERMPDSDLWARFENVRPAVLGALLDGLAFGLKTEPTVRKENLPRCADFARWGMACERSYWLEGTFERAYTANRAAAVETVLEADSAIIVFRTWFSEQDGEWEGRISALHTELQENALAMPGNPTRSRFWPDTTHRLSRVLRRAAPNLRRVGINIDFDKKGGQSWVVLRKTESWQKFDSSYDPPIDFGFENVETSRQDEMDEILGPPSPAAHAHSDTPEPLSRDENGASPIPKNNKKDEEQ